MATEPPRLEIRLEEVSKRFGRQWIIRQRNATYRSGTIYGIRGRNGSGKSTLLRLLAGQLSPTRGRVSYLLDGRPLPVESVFRQVSWTGPYLEIVEELTVSEFLSFHFTLKPLLPGLTVELVLDRIGLRTSRHLPLTDCSSGMRQRVLLASALYANTPLLLLDEPTVTLDSDSAAWFQAELARYGTGRLTIVASNDERDLVACASTDTL